MPSYKVEVLVTYKVEADSEEDAMEIIQMGTEFPVMPFNENTYATNDEILTIKENN